MYPDITKSKITLEEFTDRNAGAMKEKELHRLRKQDLLKLLLTQGKEAATLQEQITSLSVSLAEMEHNNERLKARLDEKDEQIEKLKGRLDDKDARIRDLEEKMHKWQKSRSIELEEAGSIAEAALKLNKVFEAAQDAADQYIYNIKRRHGTENE